MRFIIVIYSVLACFLAGSENELLNQLSQVLAGMKTGVYSLETVLQVTQLRQSVLIIHTNTPVFDRLQGGIMFIVLNSQYQ